MDERLRKLERDALSDPMARFRFQAERFRVDPNAENYAGFLDALAHRQDIELLDLDLDYTEDPQVISILEIHRRKLTFCGMTIKHLLFSLYGIQKAIYLHHHPGDDEGRYISQPYLDEFVIERLGIYIGSGSSAEFTCLVERRDQPTNLGFSVYRGELECFSNREVEITEVEPILSSEWFRHIMPASAFMSWEYFEVSEDDMLGLEEESWEGTFISCRYGHPELEPGSEENHQSIEDAKEWWINNFWNTDDYFKNLITVYTG
jgi:hypothetical protein